MYSQHFLIWSCKLYGGGDLVKLSMKTRCHPPLFLSRYDYSMAGSFIKPDNKERCTIPLSSGGSFTMLDDSDVFSHGRGSMYIVSL